MRRRFRTSISLPALLLAGAVAAGAALAGPSVTPVHAADVRLTAAHSSRPLPPTGSQAGGTLSLPGVRAQRLTAGQLPPHRPAPAPTTDPRGAAASGRTASCTPADFSSRTGAELASFVRAASTDCVNTLFAVTGANASGVFRESQMRAVAEAFRAASASYPGDDSTGLEQLALFLRAGYYVQFYDAADVGAYDVALTDAVAGGLDAFVASPHLADVSDANGQVAGEVVTLTDSAGLQARYLPTYQRILNGYTSSYDRSWYMVNFVNDVFTPLFRGHQNPDFVRAVTADPGIVDALDAFAQRHRDLLGGTDSFLDANAGVETARFVQHPALHGKVRPLIKGLLDASRITGPTAALWVGVAGQAAAYDQSRCSYYGVCDLPKRLLAAALPIRHSCDATHSVVAQDLTPADLAAVCVSLQGQDPFVHRLFKDHGPIPGQHEASVRIVNFASRSDYQTYAGPIFGVDTNNGGITLTGDPADPANQPMSITYRQAHDDGFVARIWNLNHEYTHALDGRYDMKGSFADEITVPDVWWIEGVAEYVSYTYRGVTDTEAMTEAAKHTYALSTLFQNTYDNSDVTRTYPWGYLAVRYMVERHPDVVQAMLAHFRTGDYAGGYAVYNALGTSDDAGFSAWLDRCAAGACTLTPGRPHAAFAAVVSGLTVRLTDRSAETGGGSIAAWSWRFGDGTGSAAPSPTRTFRRPGTYTVTLTVTDSHGHTATVTRRVTVTAPR